MVSSATAGLAENLTTARGHHTSTARRADGAGKPRRCRVPGRDGHRQHHGQQVIRIQCDRPDEFFELPDRAELGQVLYAGSITEIKDLLTLVRAIDRVRRALAPGPP